jgi:hypothetical protein
MSESKRVSINKIDYEVIKFYYIDGKYNGDDYFSLLDECSKENSKIKCGEIYILIPGWVEMQDLYQKSSEQDIQTKKYVINLQKLRMNKIKLFCIKIVDNESKSHFINDELINNMYPSLGNFIFDQNWSKERGGRSINISGKLIGIVGRKEMNKISSQL